MGILKLSMSTASLPLIEERSVTLTALAPEFSPRTRVMRQVEEWIRTGALADGRPVPSERVLAQQLGVDRRTVRSALNLMSEEGLLRSNGGRLRLVVAPEATKPRVWELEPRRGGLLDQTIAVLSINPGAPTPGQSMSGWSGKLGAGAVEAIREAGMHVLALHPDFPVEETVARLAEAGPRGVVIPEAKTKKGLLELWAQMLGDAGIHVACYGDSPEARNLDRVVSDHEGGTYQLTNWLIQHGRRRILNVWPSPAEDYWFASRRAGYERAVREAGLEVLPTILVPPAPGDPQSRGRLWAGYLLEYMQGPGKVDAVMVCSDGHVPEMAAVCGLFGRVPNRDVWIAGYDNYWAEVLSEGLPRCPVATVDKGNYATGQEMVRLLVERTRGELPAEPQRRLVPGQLVDLLVESGAA